MDLPPHTRAHMKTHTLSPLLPLRVLHLAWEEGDEGGVLTASEPADVLNHMAVV